MTVSPPMCLGLISVRSVLVLTMTFLYVLPLTPLTSAMTRDPYHDYCIIGAGPAGLQMAYFLKKNNRDYMIFERSNVSGHFFETYPRHRKLISINKRNTGQTNKEFNLRHDWNSLLSDDESLLFTKYSKDMFPPADRLLDYLRDYQQKLGLKVQWNTEVSNIHNVQNLSAPDGVLHVFSDQRGQQYTCKVLVVATGMWKPNIPKFEGMELTVGYEDMSIDPNDYEGKTVMILAACMVRMAGRVMAGSNNELQVLTTRLEESAGAYGMEVSHEKSKVLVNSTNDTSADITMNGQKLEEVSHQFPQRYYKSRD